MSDYSEDESAEATTLVLKRKMQSMRPFIDAAFQAGWRSARREPEAPERSAYFLGERAMSCAGLVDAADVSVARSMRRTKQTEEN